jgi:HemY protein
MKLAITIIVLLLLIAAMVTVVQAYPGLVVVAVGHYEWEMALSLFVLLVVLSCVVLYVLARFISRLWHARRDMAGWRSRRGFRKNVEKLHQGYKLLAEGKYDRAQTVLAQAAQNKQPMMAMLGAAEAANKLGDSAGRDAWLKRLLEQDPAVASVVYVQQADYALESNDADVAQVALDALDEETRQGARAQTLQARIYVLRHQWQALLDMLKAMKKRPPAMLRDREYMAYEAIFNKADDDLQEQAANWLQARLEKQWDDRLALLFAERDSADVGAKVQALEKWTRHYPDKAFLQRELGAGYIQQQLWGMAQKTLHASLEIEDTPRTRELLEQAGQQQE